MGDVVIMPVIRKPEPPSPQWRWFALTVAPGKEFAAERILRADGFDVFVPIKYIEGRPQMGHAKLPTGRWVTKKQRRVIARPKLNGYVFIGFDRFDIPWLNVMRFRMIVGVIAHGGAPYPFSEPDMRYLALGSSRPVRYVNAALGKKKRKRPNAIVASGPHEGKQIRCVDIAGEVELYELVEPHLAKR